MRRKRWQRGMSIVELMIVLAVGAAVAAGALAVYFFQVRPSMYIDGKAKDFESLAMSLEQIRGLYGNAYPAGVVPNLGALQENPGTPLERLLVARIGPFNSKYNNWGYNCPRGGSLSVTVYVGETDDQNQRFSVFTNLVQNNRGVWDCGNSYTGGTPTFVCTQRGSTCR